MLIFTLHYKSSAVTHPHRTLVRSTVMVTGPRTHVEAFIPMSNKGLD